MFAIVARSGSVRLERPSAVELHELPDHALLAQHLGDGKHQIGRRRAFRQSAMQLEADHVGNQHGKRLAEHGGFGFDTSDAPAEDAQPIDHGRVRIGSHQRIGISGQAPVGCAVADHAGQIFEVHLVADTDVRRDHCEILKSVLSPAQELIALHVALELQLGIEGKCLVAAELVDLHGMVDHQLGREQGIDLLGVAAHSGDGVAHGRKIGDGRARR